MAERELSIEEGQKVALGVLKAFDRICEEERLRYYLMYGTLIGAIRHGGFIPWDDDIDVMMPRKDFDRFVKYATEHEKELFPLKLHTRANTKGFCFAISRFSDMRYRYVNTDAYEKTFDIGAFIDIYPWDNFCNTPEEAEKVWRHCRKMNLTFNRSLIPNNETDSFRTAVIRKVTYHTLRTLKGKDYDQKIDAKVRDYILAHTSDTDRYFGHIVWAGGVCQFDKSKLMDMKAVRHGFAGESFSIPAAYDYLLTTSYGDYMALPPEKDRHPSHDYRIFERAL